MSKNYTIVAFFYLLTLSLQAQNVQYPYYVVVGGFAVQANAERFTAKVLEMNYPAEYALNTERNLYYVFVRVTDDKQAAKELAYKLRTERIFKDAWIYNGGAIATEAYAKSNASKTDRNEVSDRTANVNEQPVVEEKIEPKEEPKVEEPVVAVSAPPAKKEGKPFLFQVVSSLDSKPVIGDIKIMETERDTVYQTYKANEVVYIPAPKSGRLVVICDMVGYKYLKRAISYKVPGGSSGPDKEAIIPIKVAPVKRGDYLDLERVKFYEHAAIMTPTSEEQLLELVNLMQSNPDYKIRLHGHTHSDASREIITLGESQNFFALEESNKKGHGSAKELSRERAEVVKKYLVSKGVDEKRISTKGQGAMLAIYEHAGANERIEVEILKH